MKRTLWLFGPLLVAASVQGAVGELSPVAAEHGQALRQLSVYAQPGQFAKRTEGDGTVSEHAMVATVGSGTSAFRVAVDSKSPDAKAPDVIRFDFSGKGKFGDKLVAPIKGKARGQSLQANITLTTLQIPIDGKTVPVSVSGMYFKSNSYRYVQFVFGRASEGDCRFGDKTVRVRVVDGNGNLRVGDVGKRTLRQGRLAGFQLGDTLIIDADKPGWRRRRTYFGSPLQVDGKWYDVVVSDGGTKVSAKPVVVQMGKVCVANENWSATLVGKKHVVSIQGGTEPIEVPADQYAVLSYRQTAGKDSTDKASLYSSGLGSPGAKALDVPAGKTTDFPVGTPLVAGVTVRKMGTTSGRKTVQIALALTDACGARLTSLSVPGKTRKPPAPKVRIFDAKGVEVYQCTLEYG